MTSASQLSRRWFRVAGALVLFATVTAVVPRWWCGRQGERWFAGDPSFSVALARDVAATLKREVAADEFTSSSDLFRHEWQFGTYQMGALGLLQVCREHPEFSAEFQPAIDAAMERLISVEMRRFDARQWGEDALESLDGDKGHVAYLGYLNLVLALHRRWTPNSRFADLNERITGALVRRYLNSASGILETYPDEAYPIDNAAALASILIHLGNSEGERLCVVNTLAHYRRDWRDPVSGLLYQAIDRRNGRPLDAPRGSGTSLAAFFLSMGEHEVSAALYAAVRRQLAGSVLGFGYVNEYPSGMHAGHGDIDSGPLLFGISISGTGFSLGASRAFGDREAYVSFSRSAVLIGTPVRRGNQLRFAMGGPLGNSILLAMFTAQPMAP